MASWLATRRPRIADRTPTCLLGAYASHLTVVETCRYLRAQPLPIAWLPEAMSDHLGCAVGRLFTVRDWHETAFGDAHRVFHSVLDCYASDPARWEEASDHFRDLMAAAIAADPRGTSCRPPARTRHKPDCGCKPRLEIGRRPRRVAAR